jgi:NADH:ubiquinone oxidoreductase subunit E
MQCHQTINMEYEMGLFDEMESRCEEIAGKAGISPDQVQSMSALLQAKLSGGSSQLEAIEAVAREHDVPIDKVQEVISHCGGSPDLGSELGSIVGGFLKS